MTSTESMTQKIRNDGKPARASRATTQPSRVPAVPKHEPLRPGEFAPSWHDLVQPGPKGFPAKTAERREKLGQVVHLHRIPVFVEPPRRGAVRAGLFRVTGRNRAAHPAPDSRIRVVKGSRTPGFVEVREGGVRERMAGYRALTEAAKANKLRTRARRDARRAAKSPAVS